jgi:hypothetical protein
MNTLDSPVTTKETQLTPEDIAGITSASREYIGSWYAADGERMRACLHPDLVKRTLLHDKSTDGWTLSRVLNAQIMVDRTNEGGGSDAPEADRIEEITILDGFRIAPA